MALKIRGRVEGNTLGPFVKVAPDQKSTEEIVAEQQAQIDQLILLLGDLILGGGEA